MTAQSQGVKCYLVGAGPGAVDLLTLRAFRVLQCADVVLYDRLVPRAVLANVPSYAECIAIDYPAAAGNRRLRDAAARVALLIRVCRRAERRVRLVKPAARGEAAAGTPCKPFVIVRLKGGDPSVFARAYEELTALKRANIPFEIIPGITAYSAAAACAGIPLTARNVSRNFAVLTGHFTAAHETAKRDVIAASDAVCYLMGVKNLKRIVAENIRAGKAAQTPIAVIENASLPTQRVRVATLATILASHRHQPVRHPAVLIIGKVAAYHRHFDWWSQRPLAGLRLVLLRAETELPELVQLITERGGVPLALPLTKHRVLQSHHRAFLAAVTGGKFRTLVLTSRRAVQCVGELLRTAGLDARCLGGFKIIAIGAGTDAQLQLYGLRADVIAPLAAQEGIRDLIVQQRLDHILLPQAQLARPWLAAWLQEHVYHYKVLPLYQTVLCVTTRTPRKTFVPIFQASHAVLLPSQSAVTALVTWLSFNLSAISSAKNLQCPHFLAMSLPLRQMAEQLLTPLLKRCYGKSLQNRNLYSHAPAARYEALVDLAAAKRLHLLKQH